MCPKVAIYHIGDNDFYWLNCEDKKLFFVIPEGALIERGIIGNETTTYQRQFKIKMQNPLHKNSQWLTPYMFDYENVDKARLLALLDK